MAREGFPNLTVDKFIDDVLLKDARVPVSGHPTRTRPATRKDICNRIEFKYLD